MADGFPAARGSPMELSSVIERALGAPPRKTVRLETQPWALEPLTTQRALPVPAVSVKVETWLALLGSLGLYLASWMTTVRRSSESPTVPLCRARSAGRGA